MRDTITESLSRNVVLADAAALEERYATQIREESNRALERGALVALGLAVFSFVSIPLTMLVVPRLQLYGPWMFTGAALLACTGLHQLARKRKVWGPVGWATLLAFASLPTYFYFACELFLPAGAATYLNGPLTYLYLVLIAITGCLFRFRLSVAAGFVAAAGYMMSVVLALPTLAEITHSDPVLQDDLVAPPIYAFKALMMIATGFAVGGISIVGKRLTLRVVRESHERAVISRLFGEYVSEEVREKLLTDPPPAEGELKEVAVLFSDIRSFSTISETMPPSDLVRRLNAYFDTMVAPIRAHGGVVDKFVGDAIMAVFGGVLSIEDPSASAVRAARAMIVQLRASNENVETPFHAGVGIHFGTVVLGSIGSADRKDFTVMGDAVNIASRVEGLTKDRGEAILITRAVYDRLPEDLRAQCRSLGESAVKGRAGAVEIFGVVV